MFEATDVKYVQFSDHNIAPTKAAHFHIFYGVRILIELENWPTYYPSKLDRSRNCPRDVDALSYNLRRRDYPAFFLYIGNDDKNYLTNYGP